MVYQVEIADTARADANAIYDWVTERGGQPGADWYEELVESLYSLEMLPHRCSLAVEAKSAKREIRSLFFGRQNNVYRILYEIDEARKTVWVLHIRHGARRRLKAAELGEMPAG